MKLLGKQLPELRVWLWLQFCGSFPHKELSIVAKCDCRKARNQKLLGVTECRLLSFPYHLVCPGVWLAEGSWSMTAGYRAWRWLFWQPVFSILLPVSARLERNWDFLCSRLINAWRCLHNKGHNPFFLGVLLGN